MLARAALQPLRSPGIGPQCPNGEHYHVEGGGVSWVVGRVGLYLLWLWRLGHVGGHSTVTLRDGDDMGWGVVEGERNTSFSGHRPSMAKRNTGRGRAGSAACGGGFCVSVGTEMVMNESW